MNHDHRIDIHSLFLVRSGNMKRGKIWGVMLGTPEGGIILSDGMTQLSARKSMRDIRRKLVKECVLLTKQARELACVINKWA